MIDLSSNLLRILHSLDETKNITQTAQVMKISQPAVSKVIAKAERDLGLTLLQRQTRPIRLSQEGKLIANHAAEILRNTAALEERLAALASGQAGSVRIGSFGPSASTRALPQLLARFSKVHPNIKLQIQEAPDAQTLDDLRRGVLDVAVLSDPWDDLDAIPLYDDHLVALVPENSELAKRDALRAQDLAAHPFILTLAGNGPMITSWFEQAGLAPDIHHQIQQTLSIVSMVQRGMGHAIVAAQALPSAALSGVVAREIDPPCAIEVSLVRQPNATASNAVALFWAFFK